MLVTLEIGEIEGGKRREEIGKDNGIMCKVPQLCPVVLAGII